MHQERARAQVGLLRVRLRDRRLLVAGGRAQLLQEGDTPGRGKIKQEQTLFNDLRQGITKRTRWFISHYDFRLGCDPLLQQGGTKIESG